MSVSRKLILGAVLMMGAGGAWADCRRGPAATVNLNMNAGRVVVDPDLAVGQTIDTFSWPMPGQSAQNYNYSCTGKNNFKAQIVATGVQDLGNKVYSTNVPGIGLRFRRGGGSVKITYPDLYPADAGWRGANYSLAGSTFELEIVKTAPVTGSGSITAGQYTSYDYEYGNSTPILTTFLSADAITIVSPSCAVLSGKNMNVDVGSIRRNDLKGVGSTAGGRDFTIQLQCSGGLNESGYANIQTSFSGTLATGTAANMGALLNEKTGSSMAKGVGIQVLKEGTPLEFNKKYNIGRLNNQEIRYLNIPLRARFYQYASTISSGEVESHMIFNLTYD